MTRTEHGQAAAEATEQALLDSTRVPLIHVGIREAASTYLQAWFANHLGCSYTSAPPLVDLSFELSRSDEPLSAVLDRRLELPRLEPMRPLTPERRLVISDEKFAMFAFGSDGFSESFCDRYLRIACHVLHQAYPDGKVLIVTRGPRAWITSAYNEYVRWPHRVRPFRVFLRTSWPYLRANLDYRFIRDLYADAFGPDRVLLLPQELLARDPDTFLRRIESFSGIDGGAGVSKAFQDRPRNVSLDPIDTEKLRRLRTLIRILHRDTPRADRNNYLKNWVLRNKFSIDDLLGDAAACFSYEADPRVNRILRRALDSLPDPPPELYDRSIPEATLAVLADQCRFLADLPEYRDHGHAYLLD